MEPTATRMHACNSRAHHHASIATTHPLCTDEPPLENLLEAEREQNKQLAARVAELEAAAAREKSASQPSAWPNDSDVESDDSDNESGRRASRVEDEEPERREENLALPMHRQRVAPAVTCRDLP